MSTIDYYAGWLQERFGAPQKISKEKTYQKSLELLQENSKDLIVKSSKTRIESLTGRAIGGIAIAKPSENAVQEAVVRFFSKYRDAFGLSDKQVTAENLKVEHVMHNGITIAKIQQYHRRIPVADARFTCVFGTEGALGLVLGRPFAQSELPESVSPRYSRGDAIKAGIKHMQESKNEAIRKAFTEKNVTGTADLQIHGGSATLQYAVELVPLVPLAGTVEFIIDAMAGLVESACDCCVMADAAIPISFGNHTDGNIDATVDVQSNQLTMVNCDIRWIPGHPKEYKYSMQLLGNGGLRLWNHTVGGPPFVRAETPWMPEGQMPQGWNQPPGITANAFRYYNESHTYAWVRDLRAKLFDWGYRAPNDANSGKLDIFPVREGRDTHVEIIVNIDRTLMETYCGGSVNHGCFSSSFSDVNFQGESSPNGKFPTVFLYNDPSDSRGSYYFGPDESPSYFILAHELAHFYSWQAGGWRGETSLKRRTLNEGFATAFGLVFAKAYWPSLTHAGRGPGTDQWDEFNPDVQVFRFSDMTYDESVTRQPYILAKPFEQLMWRMVNNYGPGGASIWMGDSQAIENTTNIYMLLLWIMTDTSTITWDDLPLIMFFVMLARDRAGIDQGSRPNMESLGAILQLLIEHGLNEPAADV